MGTAPRPDPYQRQVETNLKRSVRFGAGLRVYLRRPWFSSGQGELLGVAVFDRQGGPLDQVARTKVKPYITQWAWTRSGRRQT